MIERDVILKTIGKTFADKLEEVIIDSGAIRITKRELVEFVGCANFIAASNLGKVLKRLKIYNAKQLYNMDPFSLARSKRIGETAMFVATCILHANGLNVEKWWGWNGNQLRFSSLKRKAIRRASKRAHEV